MPEELSNADRRALDLALSNLFFATSASLNTVIEARAKDRALAEPMADAATEAMSQQRSQLDSLLQERFNHSLRLWWKVHPICQPKT
jgi:pyoverdine/dityrosine biosynthesis protein Dit1